MKKLLSVLFILLLITIGCNNKKNLSESSISSDSSEYLNPRTSNPETSSLVIPGAFGPAKNHGINKN